MKDKDLDKLFQEASKKASFGDAAAGWDDMKTKFKGAGIAPSTRKSWFNLNSILLILLLLMTGSGTVWYFVNDNSVVDSQQLVNEQVSLSDKNNIHAHNTSSSVDRNLDSTVEQSDSKLEGLNANRSTEAVESDAAISKGDMNKRSLLSSEQSSQLDSSSEFNAKSDEQSASIVQIEGHDGQNKFNRSDSIELVATRADLANSERNSSLLHGKESEAQVENSKSNLVIATDNFSKEDSSGFMLDNMSLIPHDNQIVENRLKQVDKAILVTGDPEDNVVENQNSENLKNQTANIPNDNSQSPKGFEERGADNESNRSKYTYYAGPSLLLPINVTFSHLPILPNPKLAKVNLPDPSKPVDQKESSFLRSRWSIGLEFSPDLSTVGLRGVEDPGYTVGLHAEYHLSSKLSLSGGVSYSKKIYFADEDIESYPGSNPNWTLDRVNANCDVIDIPVNLSYYLNGYDASGFVFSGGLSTYFMLTEDYDIIYNDPWPEGSQFFRNDNQHFLGILNLSVGYRKRLSPILSLQVEPFIKIPIQGIGAGDLDLYTSGLRLILKYNRLSFGQN